MKQVSKKQTKQVLSESQVRKMMKLANLDRHVDKFLKENFEPAIEEAEELDMEDETDTEELPVADDMMDTDADVGGDKESLVKDLASAIAQAIEDVSGVSVEVESTDDSMEEPMEEPVDELEPTEELGDEEGLEEKKDLTEEDTVEEKKEPKTKKEEKKDTLAESDKTKIVQEVTKQVLKRLMSEAVKKSAKSVKKKIIKESKLAISDKVFSKIRDYIIDNITMFSFDQVQQYGNLKSVGEQKYDSIIDKYGDAANQIIRSYVDDDIEALVDGMISIYGEKYFIDILKKRGILKEELVDSDGKKLSKEKIWFVNAKKR